MKLLHFLIAAEPHIICVFGDGTIVSAVQHLLSTTGQLTADSCKSQCKAGRYTYATIMVCSEFALNN